MQEKLSDYVTVVKANRTGEVIGAIIMRDGKELALTTGGARELIKEKRFFDGCKCRPIIQAAVALVLIGGEDDCPVHGFTENDDEVE